MINDETNAATAAFAARINEIWDHWAEESEENQKLRAAAINIVSRAPSYPGPHGLSLGLPGGVLMMSVKGTVAFSQPVAPVWTLYIEEVRAVIESLG